MTWRLAKLSLHYLFLTGTLTLVTSFVRLWTFDLLNLTTTTTNPELVDLDMQVVRLDRGRYGFRGFVDIKQEFGDEVLVTIEAKRSFNINGPYSILPYFGSETLSAAMNKYYKTLIMPSVVKCCDNAPEFKGKFVPPLTSRYIKVNNCVMYPENMPSIMLEGYYWCRVTLSVRSGIEVNVSFLTYVENK